ncbi:MAG TPA: LCP family protein [Actinomycetota bacterium]|nr:LCP family protein [Actinomycetota bacterium]
MTDRRATTFQGSSDRWANLEALGAAAGQRPRPSKPKRSMSSRRRRNLLRTLAIVLTLVVVLAGAGAVWAYRYADRLVGKGQRPVAGLTPAVAGRPMNILLVGSDSRAGLSRRQLGRIQTVEVAGRRTDTIMVLHVSPGRDKAVMVSLPRDLRSTVNGKANKINAAFAFGGPDLLVKTVEEATGLAINHYAEIDFAGFLNVVDALGGVTLCNRSGHRLDDSYANLHMDPGCQKMNGVKALAFVRARHVDSDFGRIGRQQEFMRAVMAEVASRGNLAGLPELMDVADIVTDHIKTDDALSTSTAIGLARRLRKLDPASLDMRVYPSVASPPRCAGCAAFVDPLPEAAILMRALARDAPTLPPVGLPGGQGISLATTPVTVHNGSGVEGAAARAATDLRRLGVKVVGTGNAATPTGQTSTLAYPPALARHARLLASVLGGKIKLVKAPDGASLTLTVGSGFRLR